MKRLNIYLQALALLILAVIFSILIFKISTHLSFGKYIDPIHHLWLFGPTIAAIILIIINKNDSLSNIGAKKIQNKQVLFLTIFIIIFTIILQRILQYYLGFISFQTNQEPLLVFTKQFSPFRDTIVWIILLFIHAGFAEEFAWRGYLFSKLKYLSWIELVLLLNTIWAIWHFPFMPFHEVYQYILFWFSTLEIGIILIYIRMKTHSVISSMILHPIIVIFLAVFFTPYFKINNSDWAGWPNYIFILTFLPPSIIYYVKGKKLHSEIIIDSKYLKAV